jgi:hypothetical protein
MTEAKALFIILPVRRFAIRGENVQEFDRRFLVKTKNKPCGMPDCSCAEPEEVDRITDAVRPILR